MKAGSIIPQLEKCGTDYAGIGLVNKYFDLAAAGDELARDHYLHLSTKASDCIRCGACEKSCPFNVSVMDRMKTIRGFFAA